MSPRPRRMKRRHANTAAERSQSVRILLRSVYVLSALFLPGNLFGESFAFSNLETFDLPVPTFLIHGINDNSDIVGFSIIAGPTTAFLRASNGTVTPIINPNTTINYTTAFGINNAVG